MSRLQYRAALLALFAAAFVIGVLIGAAGDLR